VALSDTCKDSIIVLCEDLARHANDGLCDTGGEDAFIAIYHLAKCAADLDHMVDLSESSFARRIDDYFLGNLIGAFAARPSSDGLTFLVEMAQSIPELAKAMKRYNALHHATGPNTEHTLNARSASYLEHIISVCDATDRVFEGGEEAQSPPS
jgi:hypothetical protein